MDEVGNSSSAQAAPSQPLVSVIMNCFNSATYLREALDTVRAQSFRNWELIFWDNQSTDQSREIFHSYSDPRFRYFHAPTHTSLGAARNHAVKQATAAWLAFLDCDDEWEPHKLSLQLSETERYGDVGIVYSPFAIH